MDAIRSAARMFNEQRAPANTGCALQAHFLDNVILEYEAINRRLHPPKGSQRQPDEHIHLKSTTLHSSSLTATASSGVSGSRYLDGLQNITSGAGDLAQQPHHLPRPSSIHMQYLGRPQAILECEDEYLDSNPAQSPLRSNPGFVDDEVWTLIFANAGFSINEGAFLLPT
jgi:hypothetical protein